MDLIKSLFYNYQLITCNQRGSTGKKRSSCISHRPWRSSAVLSPSWDWDHSTLGPCWEPLVLTSENHVFIAPFCSLCNSKWGIVPPELFLRVAVAETPPGDIICFCLIWPDATAAPGTDEVFHRRHYPKLMLHALYPQCTQATAHFLLLPSHVWPSRLTFCTYVT